MTQHMHVMIHSTHALATCDDAVHHAAKMSIFARYPPAHASTTVATVQLFSSKTKRHILATSLKAYASGAGNNKHLPTAVVITAA